MTNVAEVEVLIRTKGAKQTEKEMDSVDKKFKKTSKEAGKSSKDMTKFAKKYGGIVEIIAASLTTTIGLLFSQVPIIQQIFGALSIVIMMLALMLDNILRPVLEPVVGFLFKLSVGFEKLPGPIKKFITVMLVVVIIVASLATAVAAVVIAFTVMGIALVIIIGITVLLVVAIGNIVATILFFQWAWKKTMELAPIYAQKAIDFIVGAWDGAKKSILYHIEAIKNGIANGFWMAKTAVDDALAALWSTAFTWFNEIKSTATGVWDSISSWAATKFEAIKKTITDVISTLKTKWETFWTDAKAFGKGVVDGIITIAEKIGAGFKTGLNAAITVINGAIDSLNGLSITIPDYVPGDLGGKSWSLNLPNIPTLYTQGRVAEGGVARVERGESVVKDRAMKLAFLEALQEAGGMGGGTFYVYLDGKQLTASVNHYNSRNMNQMGVF